MPVVATSQTSIYNNTHRTPMLVVATSQTSIYNNTQDHNAGSSHVTDQYLQQHTGPQCR